MSNVFEESTPNPFNELVGEGKKFATPEALAAGKLEADRTIAARNLELEQSRQEQERLRQELESLRNSREPTTPNTERVATAPVEDQSPDLATRIREELARQTQQDIQNQNLAQVVSKLEEAYGDKAREVITSKANELGVSTKWLEGVAAQSPKAFLAHFDLTSVTPPAASTKSDVNTIALADTRSSTAVKEGTYKFYEAIRRDNPKLYFSADTQNRMFSDAKRLGEAFYN